MKENATSIDRRSFLGLGAAAAAAGALGLAGCTPKTSGEASLSETGASAPASDAVDWLGVEPEIAESDIVETI
uniref:twin-arginine translocation signal domain-containing protein n=1 Tax=uncultured Adlercreutzia sp. TaxID=875803 RepID=UPI00272EA11A